MSHCTLYLKWRCLNILLYKININVLHVTTGIWYFTPILPCWWNYSSISPVQAYKLFISIAIKHILTTLYWNPLSIWIVEFSISVGRIFAAFLFVSLAVECTLSFSNSSDTNSTVVVINYFVKLKVNTYRENLERSLELTCFDR